MSHESEGNSKGHSGKHSGNEFEYPLIVDERGFVWMAGIRLPFRFIAKTNSIQTVIKDKRQAERLGVNRIDIPLIDLYLLSVLYPSGGGEVFKSCPACARRNIAQFAGKGVDNSGELSLYWKCLHCGKKWKA